MEIDLKKIGRKCSGSDTIFKHGDAVVSLVRPSEEGLAREDYHSSFWHEGLSEGALAVWRTVYRDASQEEESERKEAASPLRVFFYEALSLTTRPGYAQAFLAAQLLRRQRVFRLLKEPTKDSGERVMLFLDLESDAIVEVPDPDFSLDELKEARSGLEKAIADSKDEEREEAGAAEPQNEERNDGNEVS
jgi:hypothetical protein